MTTTQRRISRTVIYDVEAIGLDTNAGGRWALVCEDHGFIIQDTNKRRLSAWRRYSADWCETCAHIANAKPDTSSESCGYVNCHLHPAE